jgi:hypothetical protein
VTFATGFGHFDASRRREEQWNTMGRKRAKNPVNKSEQKKKERIKLKQLFDWAPHLS